MAATNILDVYHQWIRDNPDKMLSEFPQYAEVMRTGGYTGQGTQESPFALPRYAGQTFEGPLTGLVINPSNPVTPPTMSQPTVNKPTTAETPAAVSGPITPPTWLGNVPSSTAMKFSDPELSLRPLQAGGSQQLFPSFQMPSFNYPASNPRQGSKNWWEMDWG